MKKVLEIKNLVKTYPKVRAVDDISLNFNESECVGLIGPNGAGKTTLMEMIEGFVKPDKGSIIFKNNAFNRSHKLELGIQLQNNNFPEYMTVLETLKMFKELYNKNVTIQDVIDTCELHEFINADNAKISGGQKQRLSLAIALINAPEILVFDEPTTGLDPQARRKIWDIILMQKKLGKTIILTTHYMEEAEILCDRIAIIDHGRIVTFGTKKEIFEKYTKGLYIELDIKNEPLLLNKELSWEIKNNKITVHTEDPNQTFRKLVQWNINLNNVRVYSQSLEDVYVKLIGSVAHNPAPVKKNKWKRG